MGRNLDRCALTLTLLLTSLAAAQQAAPPPETSSSKPLPPIPQLLLNVERNEKASEAARKDYTYHIHFEEQNVDSKGATRKSTTTDAESLTIHGVRIDRIIAHDGKPLTPEEAKKENERIDKEVARARQRRERRSSQGKDTDANGDIVISAARILELGTFSNPRRIDIDGRPTIVVDYTGDPATKTRNSFETAVRDLVGTVSIDEHDQVLARAQGHFINDFKIAGGLLANIRRGSSFDIHYTKINNEVWLPSTLDSQGQIRLFLFASINGRFRMVMSNYKKFRTTTTIIDSNRVIGPDGQPVPDDPAAESTGQPSAHPQERTTAQPPTPAAPQTAPSPSGTPQTTSAPASAPHEF